MISFVDDQLHELLLHVIFFLVLSIGNLFSYDFTPYGIECYDSVIDALLSVL